MIPTFLTKREYKKTSKTAQDKKHTSSNERNYQIEQSMFSQKHQPTNSFSLLEELIPNTQAKSNPHSLQPMEPSFISQHRFESISEYNTSLPSQSDTHTVSEHIRREEGIFISHTQRCQPS